MKALLDDLVSFNRTRLGLGIKVELAEVDLTAAFADELELLRGAHPSRQIELEVVGNTRGLWDRVRLQQLLRNLVVNAIIHGSPDSPIHVVLTGDETDVTIEVKNHGPAIGKENLGGQIFDPLKRGLGSVNRDDRESGLGLGLFIVREIARAHDGEVTARSDKEATLFAVKLPLRNQNIALKQCACWILAAHRPMVVRCDRVFKTCADALHSNHRISTRVITSQGKFR